MRTDHETREYACELSAKSSLLGLSLLLLCHGCAAAPDASLQQVGLQTQAMINDDTEGVNCNTCAGGECAALHCFENWVQGGGGGDGPYADPGGSPGGGSWDEPEEPAEDGYKCIVNCTGAYYPCLSVCDNPYSQPAGELCKQDCSAALDVCFEVCKARFPSAP